MAEPTPDKRIVIDGVNFGHGTSIKGSRDTSSATTTTFDGVITSGTRNISHSIDFSRIVYEGATNYIDVSRVILKMLEIPAPIFIYQDVQVGKETVNIRWEYYDCVVDGDDYEIKPEEHTVENLKFKAGSLKKFINDTEITPKE